MKSKTVFMFVTLVFMSQAEALDVKVSNIAGFATVPVKPEHNLIGSPFIELDGRPTDINDLFSWKNLLGMDDFNFQSMLLTWNNMGCHHYGWCGLSQGTVEFDCPEFDGKWLRYGMDAVATNDIANGEGFWFTTTHEQTLVFTGQVCTNAFFTTAVTNGHNLLCNPFPAVINIQDVNSPDLIDDDGVNDFQWELSLRTETVNFYEIFSWCNEGEGAAGGFPQFDSKWLNADMTEVADATIGIGEAFWIKAVSPMKVTIRRPTSLSLMPNNGK